MTAASPLLVHASQSAVVAHRRGEAISAAQFLADARDLSCRMPPATHILNVCADRYWFAVGLAACLITKRVSLLPSTHTPEVIRDMLGFAPDVLCLTDTDSCQIDLPQLQVTPRAATDLRWDVPQIPADQVVAIVFTSGSSGTPLPHRKTWGKLTRCVRDEALLLGFADGAPHTLVGTVPAQHMYGFETTVLLALQSGNALCAERPFYPADICATLAGVPRPRVLVTTPVHLRALLAAGLPLPPLELIISATAPLAEDLAQEVETTFQAPLLEIYGSTETGQIAMRRTAAAPLWRLWPEVRLVERDGQVLAQGGHVERPTALCDVIEISGEREFLLHGRIEDMVNVAGKRSSFGYLNAQLNAIDGVLDGAFFLPQSEASGATGVARLAAVVAAPSLNAAQLTDALRLRVDPVFLPRPLLLVDRLPRNATGKLPRQELLALLDRHAHAGSATELPSVRRCALSIPADHAAYAGHFPASPILPGAALLDETLHEIARSRGLNLCLWRVASAKFLAIVAPGTALTLEHSAPAADSISFTVRSAERAVASGVLSRVAAGRP